MSNGPNCSFVASLVAFKPSVGARLFGTVGLVSNAAERGAMVERDETNNMGNGDAGDAGEVTADDVDRGGDAHWYHHPDREPFAAPWLTRSNGH